MPWTLDCRKPTTSADQSLMQQHQGDDTSAAESWDCPHQIRATPISNVMMWSRSWKCCVTRLTAYAILSARIPVRKSRSLSSVYRRMWMVRATRRQAGAVFAVVWGQFASVQRSACESLVNICSDKTVVIDTRILSLILVALKRHSKSQLLNEAVCRLIFVDIRWYSSYRMRIFW